MAIYVNFHIDRAICGFCYCCFCCCCCVFFHLLYFVFIFRRKALHVYHVYAYNHQSTCHSMVLILKGKKLVCTFYIFQGKNDFSNFSIWSYCMDWSYKSFLFLYSLFSLYFFTPVHTFEIQIFKHFFFQHHVCISKDKSI